MLKVLHNLMTKSYIVGVLAHGARKLMAIVKLDGHPERHMDLLLTSHAEYPFALTYFTGSAKFNVEMRKVAVEQGLTLNEHALTTKAGVPVHGITTEKKLFEALKISWKDPEDR